MKDFDLVGEQPSKNALRRLRRRVRKECKRELRLQKASSFHFMRGAQLRVEAEQHFKATEDRRLKLLHRRQTDMASALALSVIEFETRFSGFDHVDLARARAYMLGERHDCRPLPYVLSVAVGNYRRDLLARRLQIESDVQVVRNFTTAQLQEVTGALAPHFNDLLDSSDGFRNCAQWHPQCKSTNDHVRTRRGKHKEHSQRWQKNVIVVYIRIVGMSAVEELYDYVLIPLPYWLRTLKLKRA